MITVYHFVLDHRTGGNLVYADAIKTDLEGSFQSIVVTTGSGGMSNISLLNIRRISRYFFPVELIINSLQIFWLLMSKKIRHKNTIFHIHGGATLAPIFVARLFRVPVVWTIHETTRSYRYFVRLGHILLIGVPHCTVVVAEACKLIYAGLSEALLIPSGIDLNFWRRYKTWPDTRKTVWALTKEEENFPVIRVLTVGNLSPIKNLNELIYALGCTDHPFSLKVAGIPLEAHRDFELHLRDLAKDAASKHKFSKIEFLGGQNRRQIRDLLASCDLFVLPSLSEACPISLLEAMAMDCYCLASDVGDVRKILENYEFVRIFSVGDKSLVSSLEVFIRVMRNTKSFISVKKMGRYSNRSMAKQYASVYKKLLSESL